MTVRLYICTEYLHTSLDSFTSVNFKKITCTYNRCRNTLSKYKTMNRNNNKRTES